MRKTRLWICYKCKVVYTRKKKDIPRKCRYCHSPMTKARKWPDEKFWEQQRKKVNRRSKNRQIEFKRACKVLDSHGYVIHVTPKAKKIWKRIERTPYLKSFELWGKRLIDEVHFNVIHTRGINGYTLPPELEIVKIKNKFEFGTYESGLLVRKYAITIYQHRPIDITQMKETLLHELLHHIDAESKSHRDESFRYSEHDKAWEIRLKKFKDLLGVGNEEILQPKF